MFADIFQPWHLLLIGLVALVVFGPGKLGDIGASLGKGLRAFRDETQGVHPPAPTVSSAPSVPVLTPTGDEQAASAGSVSAAAGAVLGRALPGPETGPVVLRREEI